MNLIQRLLLSLILRNKPLPRPPKPHIIPLTQLIQQILPTNTQLRLETASPVVDARVDDLAVSGTGLGTDSVVPLDEQRGGIVAQGQLARDCEADYAAADDLMAISMLAYRIVLGLC